MSISYTREVLNPMKVEELRKIASSLKISCSKLKKQECIDSILNIVKSQKSSILSESFLRSKTSSELRKIIIDNKDKYNCCASKISGDKIGKELMINIILEKIKCPKDYLVEEVVSRSPSPSPKSRSRSPSPSPKSRSPIVKYSKDDLDKMNVKQITDIVKKMGLDSLCKVGVTKPVLIDYILKGDCSKENRKKGKENIKVKSRASSPVKRASSPVKRAPSPVKYKESDLKKLTKNDLVDIVKKMGLDSVCKLEVTKPVLIDYILKGDCPADKKKKIISKPKSSPVKKASPPSPVKYKESDLKKLTKNDLVDIVKKMGLDSVCKLEVTKPVLIDYILKGDCPADKRKKGKEDVDLLKLLKPEISYTEKELSKKTDIELKDIIRSLGLDIICNLNVSREILTKYILLRGCPEELFKTSSPPSSPPSPSSLSSVSLPSPPKSLPKSLPPSPKEDSLSLEEESDSDVSSVDEIDEDIDTIDRQKLIEMSKALRECLGFTQKKL
jgi:hypothetical protein